MKFERYQHIERFGKDEVQGIETGTCYIFPKLDGTNASVWWNDGLQFGSRNRQISADFDNQGFYESMKDNECLLKYFDKFPSHRLYGEWLVPHTLKTYRDASWRRFWIFDIMDGDKYIKYEDYAPYLELHGLDFVRPMKVVKNPTFEFLLGQLAANTYLIKTGKGCGEGIVIKNYEYKNRFGRTIWAKLVRTEFKEKNAIEFGVSSTECIPVECQIVDKYCTKAFIDKEVAKIVAENSGWKSQYIPMLLGKIFYELVNEEIWHAIKEFKRPVIDFKRLNNQTISKIKELRSDLF